MIPYANASGNSGVRAYHAGGNYIDVQFIDGKVYRYTTKSAGINHIHHMKGLAKNGRGLSTYISRYVKDGYESKG